VAHKIFISYHHEQDQVYADILREFYGADNTFIDCSLSEEIESDDDDYILAQIRTRYLRDSTVTIVLIGRYTWSRKWVDWEIYSSLRPYGTRTVNGLLGILLPTAGNLWPARFVDNYRVEQLHGHFVQTGYARLVRCEEIAPPLHSHGSSILHYLTARAKLVAAIESAYNNRCCTYLINNARPRLKKNLPVVYEW